MVVGTAERHIQIYNLTNPTTPFRVRTLAGNTNLRHLTDFRYNRHKLHL